MAQILPRDLPPIPGGTINPAAAFIVDNGDGVFQGTPANVVDAGAPVNTQGAAEAGVVNTGRMTPLRTAQAIAALGVSQAVLESPAGGDMVGLPQGKLAEAIKYVTPEMHGASAIVLDNAAALTAAAAAAALRGVDLVLSTNYPCTTGVTIAGNVALRGNGKEASGIISSAVTAVNVTGSGAEFHDMAIVCTGTARVALASIDNDAPTLRNCRIDGRSYFLNSLDEERRGPAISGCDIHCDFGADYNGVDEYDVISLYGLFGTKLIGNDFNVNNVHRLVKCTDISTVSDPAEEVSPYNSRGFVFSGNSIRGGGGKQVFDLYSGSSGVHITDNHFELSDDVGDAGARWTSVIENKSAANARDVYDIGGAIVVEGNTGYIGRCPFVTVQGSFGITQSGFTGTRRNTIKLKNNDIRRTVDNATPLIDIRFFNEVVSDGNTWEIPNTTANRTVAGYYSNESVVVGAGDTYSGGYIEIASQTSNLSGLTFGGALGTVDIGACMVRNYDGRGAVWINSVVSVEAIRVVGLKSRPKGSPTQSCRAVSCQSNTAISYLDIIGCHATHPSGGNVAPLYDTAATAAYGAVKDNNWQPCFRGYAVGLPGSGNFLRGDTLRQVSPSIGSPVEWTCHTAGSPGGWRVSSYIMGSGTTGQRPTLGASDAGVFYQDTTLNAGGQLIRWNGTNWKDVAGATV